MMSLRVFPTRPSKERRKDSKPDIHHLKHSLLAHYFKIALLLREILLLNGILTNSDLWYGITESEILDLENLDETFLDNSVRVSADSSHSQFVLGNRKFFYKKMKRINYLHNLLKLGKTKILSKFLWDQWESPVKAC